MIIMMRIYLLQFTDCISEISNTQVDDTRDIDVVIPMYNLIEYIENYSKTSGSLQQYYSNKWALTDTGAVDNFPGNSALLKFKQKMTSKTAAGGTKNFETMVPLKYLSNARRTLDMPLIKYEINLF